MDNVFEAILGFDAAAAAAEDAARAAADAEAAYAADPTPEAADALQAARDTWFERYSEAGAAADYLDEAAAAAGVVVEVYT